MLSPYHMIVVNIILIIFLAIVFLTFKLLFPTRKINLLFLLIILSLLPLVSILRQGTYESGDLSHHTVAILSMSDSLRDGNIIPRWGGDLYFGYGGPYHIILYFLPRYLSALLHLAGFPILDSVKLIIALSFSLSGISMYYYLKSKIDERAGFVAGILYLFAPYHLVDLHFRVEPGELAVFALLPFLLYSLDKLLKYRNYRWTLILALTLAATILSHQALALLFIPLLLLYYIFQLFGNLKYKGKKTILLSLSIIISILLTAFYWITIMIEGSKYTEVYNIFEQLKSIPFIQFSELIYSPWRSGFLFQGPIGQLSFVLGYAHWIFILGAIYIALFVRKNKYFPLLLFSLIGFLSILFFMTKWSEPFWNHIPLIKYSQNSYRLLVFLVFFSSLAAGIISKNLKNWLVVSLCVVAILSSILNWGNRRTIPEIFSDSQFRNMIPTFQTDFNGYGYDLPIWVDPKITPYNFKPKSEIEIISGKAIVKKLFRSSTSHEYLLSSSTQIVVRENTFYFPGWNVYANDKKIPIDYQYKNIPGIITFKLPAGVHKVKVVFENTIWRNIGDVISLITLIIIAIFFLLRRFK